MTRNNDGLWSSMLLGGSMSLAGMQFGLRYRSDNTGKVFRHLDLPLEMYALFFTVGSAGFYAWHRACDRYIEVKKSDAKDLSICRFFSQLSKPIPYAFMSLATSYIIVCYAPESFVKAVLRSMGEQALQQTRADHESQARQILDDWGEKINQGNDKAHQTMTDWGRELEERLGGKGS